MWKIDIVQEANRIKENKNNQKENMFKLMQETDIKYEEINIDDTSVEEMYDMILNNICERTQYIGLMPPEEEKLLEKLILYMAQNNHWCFIVEKEDKHSYYLLFEQNCHQQEYCKEWNKEMNDCDLYFEDDCQWGMCGIMEEQADEIYELAEKINEDFKNEIEEAIISDYLPNAIYIHCKGYEF